MLKGVILSLLLTLSVTTARLVPGGPKPLLGKLSRGVTEGRGRSLDRPSSRQLHVEESYLSLAQISLATALQLSGGGSGGKKALEIQKAFRAKVARLKSTRIAPSQNEDGASIPNEIFNLVKSIVGAGVLGLPAGMSSTTGGHVLRFLSNFSCSSYDLLPC